MASTDPRRRRSLIVLRPSRQVKALAQAHLRELDAKLLELHAMRGALEHLVSCCAGDERPDCPIIEGLADHPSMLRS